MCSFRLGLLQRRGILLRPLQFVQRCNTYPLRRDKMPQHWVVGTRHFETIYVSYARVEMPMKNTLNLDEQTITLCPFGYQPLKTWLHIPAGRIIQLQFPRLILPTGSGSSGSSGLVQNCLGGFLLHHHHQ